MWDGFGVATYLLKLTWLNNFQKSYSDDILVFMLCVFSITQDSF